ncbi:MAG: tyrosine-type recombinase/integrase [Pseudomonadales bacterium]
MKKGRNDNYPKKGASIKVQPIRNHKDIQAIKHALSKYPRNYCLFTMGINTAYRANELLSLTIGQVAHLKENDILDLKQSKNKEYRPTALNGVTVSAIQHWLKYYPRTCHEHAPLFLSQHSRKALTVPALNHRVKKWCQEAGIEGNYGSHSLRKTWGYHQRTTNKASVALLMKAFAHIAEEQTLEYLCILPEEIQNLYTEMEL